MDWQNLFAMTRFCYEVFSIYFIYWPGAKKILFVILMTWLYRGLFYEGSTVISSGGGGGGGGQGVLPYMGYIGMCHCEGYGFQAVFSWIGYINQIV